VRFSFPRALHIISDPKFIDKHVSRFEKIGLVNRFIFLNKVNNYQGEYSTIIEFINEEDILSVKALSKAAINYEFIFVYFLNFGKVKFINYLDCKDPKVIWFFYGAELYNNIAIINFVLSDDTKRILGVYWKSKSILYLKETIRVIKYALKGKLTPNKEFLKAVKRIDYFAWYSKEEYDFLLKKCKIVLPKFLQLNIKLTLPIKEPLIKHDCKILIGNSRDPLNNHIDVINILKSIEYKGNISFPFSYGEKKKYSNYIRLIVSNSKLAIELIEDFMPYNHYLNFVGQHSTAIFNSYRQMGLGNILVALWSGLKIYLSLKNPTYQWLKNLGFIIFSIEEDLLLDLKSNNLILDNCKIAHNFHLYADLSKDENNFQFIEKLHKILS
jgi:dTDP-N-acetylfucosamine:lipid II N-acetylfucosaminyltransferase